MSAKAVSTTAWEKRWCTGPLCKAAMPTCEFKDPRNRNACVVTFPFGADADVGAYAGHRDSFRRWVCNVQLHPDAAGGLRREGPT